MLNPFVLTQLLLDGLISGPLLLSAAIGIPILRNFDIRKADYRQLLLEKRALLAGTIIQTLLIIKIISVIHFIYLTDSLAQFIPGAMCAFGVFHALDFGYWLLFSKVLGLYLIGIWLVLHDADQQTIDFAYIRPKYKLLLAIGFLSSQEFCFEYYSLLSIDYDNLVTCCSTIFNAADSSVMGLLLSIPNSVLIMGYVGVLCFLLMSLYMKDDILSFGLSFIHGFLFIILLINVTSIYIYQLPTHACPFCMLQSDYFYIGYLIYALFLMASFTAISPFIIDKLSHCKFNAHRISLNLHVLLSFILLAIPIVYRLRTGTWL